jgi:hypothetical protein
MLECWNCGILGKTRNHWTLFDLPPLDPSFHDSIIPNGLSPFLFLLVALRAKKSSFDYHIVANLSSNF